MIDYSELLDNQKVHYEPKYHNMNSCNACGHPSSNSVIVTDTISSHISEARTTCQVCGHDDYWAYGFFESSQDIESKCLKY